MYYNDFWVYMMGVCVLDVLKKGEAPWLLRLRQFFLSPWYMAALFALAAIVTIFRIEIVGMVVFVVLFSVQMVLCDNILSTATPVILGCLFIIRTSEMPAFSKESDALVKMFLPWAWLIVIPIGALIVHLILYRKPLVWGRASWAILAVSCAVMLGGVGSISAKEYFSGASLYHMFALGFGMLICYVWLSSALEHDKDGWMQKFIPNLMVMIGLFASFMILHLYLANLPRLIEHPQLLAFQWRNNVCTFLMLALPFPFFKAFQKPVFIIPGLIMFLALLLSGSRGGMLFGTIEFFMCLMFVLLADRKRRLLYLVITVLIVAALIACIPLLLPFFWPVIYRLLQSVFNGEQEVRMQLYRRAVEDFMAHPIFGVGIGYMGNRDVHPSKDFALCWYHCAPLQIIGSMGLTGLAAYIYQYVVRVKIFLHRPITKFRLTLFLSWLGLELMSLVNPGVFAPIPYLLIVTIFLVVAEKSSPEVKTQFLLKKDLLKKKLK